MLTFNPNCKTTEELRELITSGTFDKSIRRYLIVLLRDGELTSDPADYFDIQADVDDYDDLIYIGTDPYSSKSNLESKLSECFAKRIREMRESITDETLKDTFKDYINANQLFLDIERYGFPKLVMLNERSRIFATFDSIEKTESNIVLKGTNFEFQVSHLSDCLKNDRLCGLFTEYNLCYHVYSDLEYSGVQLYFK